MALNAFASLAFESGLDSRLLVGFAITKHLVDQDHHRMSDGYDRALAPDSRG